MTNVSAPGATDDNQAIATPDGEIPNRMSARQQEMPLAMVHGQPLLQIPQDLYIPPDALEVILDAFEGPLDLLLYLIRRQNLEILDIPVAEITRQYVDYIQAMQHLRFELAAEYLVMAAILAEIKSRMLLPRAVLDDDDESDPRAELVRRLQEYERFKKAAQDIDALPRTDEKHAGPRDRKDQSPADIRRLEIVRTHVLAENAPESDPLFHTAAPVFSFSRFTEATSIPVTSTKTSSSVG